MACDLLVSHKREGSFLQKIIKVSKKIVLFS